MFKEQFETISKKIENRYDILNEHCIKIRCALGEIADKVKWVTEHDKAKDGYLRTVESQQRTIEQLTKALCDKYEHGLFIFSEDCKIPMVIRNGKELTNDLTSSFSIEWDNGNAPNIQIEQFAGTNHGMDD